MRHLSEGGSESKCLNVPEVPDASFMLTLAKEQGDETYFTLFTFTFTMILADGAVRASPRTVIG